MQYPPHVETIEEFMLPLLDMYILDLIQENSLQLGTDFVELGIFDSNSGYILSP